jgi:DNA-binding PadR family transcriptional regulator
MSVKTVILGLLKKEPLHGYEIKRIIEQEMGDWTDIAFGSIYFALDALAKDGFVTAEVQESAQRRPSRIVYTITHAGEGEYLRLLRELWQDTTRQRNPLDIGIAFMRDLPTAEVKKYLAARIGMMEEILRNLREHERETLAQPGMPRESRFIFSHARHQLEAELAWLREVSAGL